MKNISTTREMHWSHPLNTQLRGNMRLTLLAVPSLLFGLLLSCEPKQEHEKELEVGSVIYDSASVLSQDQRNIIFNRIKDLNKRTGSQVAIVTTDTLNGQTIEHYSLITAEKLELDRKINAGGVLITVAIKNRQIRIEVGTGLERILKDEIVSRIIRNKMAPWFRKNDYASGLTNAVRSIDSLIENNKKLIQRKPL
jgi:uncharacterized membrane protein YgcG